MEKIVEQGLLYDFYGELLTKHQRKVYEDSVYNDLSLSEIAEDMGISRQGVHDLIKRCDHSLQEYEEKLHLVQRFLSIKEKMQEIKETVDILCDSGEQSGEKDLLLENIRTLSEEVLKEL